MRQSRWPGWISASFRFSTHRRPRGFRPQVMVLEDRRLLSTMLSSEPGFASYAGVGFQENSVAGLYGVFNGQEDPNPADYQVQINWGDSSDQWQPADLARANPGQGFLVKGSHIYDTANSYKVQVRATGPDGVTVTNTTCSVVVSPMPSGIPGTAPNPIANSLPPSNVRVDLSSEPGFACYAGVGFQENNIASLNGYVNGQADLKLGDYHAQVNWGDSNQWDMADLASANPGNPGSGFLIKGSHIYAQAGTYHVVVYAQGPDGTSTSRETLNITVAQMPSGVPGTAPKPVANSLPPSNVRVDLSSEPGFACYAGVGFQENNVASLNGYVNGQADLKLGDYHAQVNWGDSNQWDTADLASANPGNPGSGFLIKGSHIYAQAGTYHVVVYAQGPDGTSTSRETLNITVAQMPSGIPGSPPSPVASSLPPSNVRVDLSSEPGFSVKAGLNTGTQTVASLNGYVNDQQDPTASDFHAQINWGDNSYWTQAALVPEPNNPSAFLVQGSHTYYKPGSYHVVVYAQGPDGTSVSRETVDVTVAANPNPPVPTLTGGVSITVLQGQELANVPLATFDSGGSSAPLSAQIDYGDSNGPNPDSGPGTVKLVGGTQYQVLSGSQTYNQPGTYKVTVTLSDPQGNGSQTTDTVQVKASPNPLFLAGNQTQPSIAVDPTNPSREFILAINIGDGLFAAYSNDGGSTWTPRVMADGTPGGDGLPQGKDDTKAAFDSFGNLFVTYADPTHTSVYLLVSTDGGQTFQVLHRFMAGGSSGIDRTWVATGPGNMPGTGSVWVAYDDSDGPNGGFQVKASGALVTGAGTTNIGSFSSPAVASGSGGGQYPSIAIGPSGQVLVSYLANDPATRNPAIFTNLNPNQPGQQDFASAPTVVTDTEVGGVYTVPAMQGTGVSVEPNLAWNRQGAVHPGRVYLTYADARNPADANDTDVFVVYSDDDGQTWHGSENSGEPLMPIRVNNDSGPATQFYSTIAVDQTTGYLGIAWYDTRNDPNNTQVQYFAAISTDGLTFSNNVPASGLPSVNPAGSNAFGDYEGVDFVNGVLYPVWTDNSLPGGGFDSHYHIMTTTITNPGGAAAVPPGGHGAGERLPSHSPVIVTGWRLYSISLERKDRTSLSGPAVNAYFESLAVAD